MSRREICSLTPSHRIMRKNSSGEAHWLVLPPEIPPASFYSFFTRRIPPPTKFGRKLLGESASGVNPSALEEPGCTGAAWFFCIGPIGPAVSPGQDHGLTLRQKQIRIAGAVFELSFAYNCRAGYVCPKCSPARKRMRPVCACACLLPRHSL